MKTLLKKLILSFVLIFATSMNIGAKVVSYPVPQTEPLSSDYTVEVNGITIPVYTASTQHHDKKYSIAYFDFSGTVTITVKSNFQFITEENQRAVTTVWFKRNVTRSI